MKSILLTGVAGFIGFHVAKKLLSSNYRVIGIDNLNPYYDVNLKKARLAELEKLPNFEFLKVDIADKDTFLSLAHTYDNIDTIIHLAAQAGVRYSLENPHAYVEANIYGHLNVLELIRKLPQKPHLVYASSSSVYGKNKKLPFSVADRVDHPMSIYAASKRSVELITESYSDLFQIRATGLRFFTVYGPWGRPDMSAFIFAKALTEDKELPVFNEGNMRRNFTYIDDIVAGVIGCVEKPSVTENVPHKVYNIGNNRSEKLLDFIQVLAKHFDKTPKLNLLPMQPGDVPETIADITDTQKDFGFEPKTNIEEGLKHFVDWYQSYSKEQVIEC